MYIKRTSKIINGRAYTDGDTALLTDLPIHQQQIVIAWIKGNIVKRKTPNYNHTSYGIKHWIQGIFHIYMTNNQFKDAMLLCGFYPVKETELNWVYCISEKSPAFASGEVYV